MLVKRSLELLQGLRKFSRSKMDWKAGSIIRSKAVNVHVDQTVLEPKVSVVALSCQNSIMLVTEQSDFRFL
jgi:hypothetical protein